MGGSVFSTLVGFDIPAPDTAPSVAPGTVVGAMGVGAYRYKVTYITAFGETDTSSTSSPVTPTSGSVVVTNIAISPDTNVTSRKLYRTTADGSTWFALVVINDNITTVFVDTRADGTLTTLAPTYNTAMSRAIARGVLSLSTPLVATNDMFIVARAGGGQADAIPLTKEYIRLVAVASAGDSVKLPHINTDLAGSKCVIRNDGANSADVFPFAGQVISSLGVDVAFALAAGSTVTFVAATDESWVIF